MGVSALKRATTVRNTVLERKVQFSLSAVSSFRDGSTDRPNTMWRGRDRSRSVGQGGRRAERNNVVSYDRHPPPGVRLEVFSAARVNYMSP